MKIEKSTNQKIYQKNSNISHFANYSNLANGVKFIILIAIFISTNIFQLNAQFGKNKVQYEKFNWKYVETKHFNIYYHEDGYYLANYAAIEAEKALQKIQNELNHKLTTKISFIVFNSHNQFQQNNVIQSFLSEGIGGVTQLYKNNIVVPFQGDYKQFQHVIFHELVHGVINDMFHGGTLQSSLANNGFFIPTWLNEGLCEYLSNGGMDTETDMFIRDLTINEELPPLDRIDGYNSYRVGQTFYWYISEKYGKPKVGEFINKLKIQKNVEQAFQRTFSMSIEDFSEKWLKDIKKYYLPDLDVFEDITDYAEKVTDRKKIGNFYNSAPAISADGTKMAFISESGGLLGISVMNLNNMKSIRNLISSFRSQDFEDLNMLSPGISWNPEGTKIAISAKAGPEDAVFIVDEKDGDYQKLSFNLKSIESVNWSPDGKMLAFAASVAEQSDIFTYEFATKKLTNITSDIFSDKTPVWTWDSKSIYFVSDRDDKFDGKYTKDNYRVWNNNVNVSDIFNIELSNSNIKRITNDGSNIKSSIAVSEDNSKILFVSDKNGIGNIYELNFANNKITPKTNSITGITQISLSRDASVMLFGAQIGGGYDIVKLKYPFEKTTKDSNIPLTRFKKEQVDKQNIIDEINNSDSEEDIVEKEDNIISYGEYEVSFENQKVVAPNPDATILNTTNTSDLDTFLVPKDYKIKFSPDLVQSNPGYNSFWGLQGAIQMMFSDELGDHNIQVMGNLFVDLQNSSLFLNYSYLPEVTDYDFSIYHQPGFVNSNGAFVRFASTGLGVEASKAFDLFNRYEYGFNFMRVSKAFVDNVSGTDIVKYFLVPRARFVHDDVLYGYYAPNKGTRYFLEAKAAPKLFEDAGGFLSLTADFRNYQALTNYITFAFRLSGGTSFGPNPQSFMLGGMENWINRTALSGVSPIPFETPEDFAFMNLQMPMRGYQFAELRGRNFALMNAELRFPLFTALVAGPLPILIQGVMGSFFLDMGTAFDSQFEATGTDEFGKTVYKDLLLSSGIGVRSYLFGLPIKMDIVWRKLYDNWTSPEYLFSLGFDF